MRGREKGREEQKEEGRDKREERRGRRGRRGETNIQDKSHLLLVMNLMVSGGLIV